MNDVPTYQEVEAAGGWFGYTKKLRDEIDRLRAALSESQQKRAEAEANLEAAHGVVVRLRAALERIAEDQRGRSPAAATHAEKIALEALAPSVTGSASRNPYEETADTLRDFLRREGYVRCDSPACNCGSYHGRFGLHERWQDMKDALAEAGHPLTNANGNTPLRALRELIAERDALRAAVPANAVHSIPEANDRADTDPSKWTEAERMACFRDLQFGPLDVELAKAMEAARQAAMRRGLAETARMISGASAYSAAEKVELAREWEKVRPAPPPPATEPRTVAYECDQCRHPIRKPAWTAFEPTCGYCGGTYRPAVQP